MLFTSSTIAAVAIACHRPNRRVARFSAPVAVACGVPLPALASPQSGSAPAPASADSFAAWLNAERAARGLRPCRVSAELCADATENSRRGFGHSFMGRARRQNAGMGALPTVCVMWVASPAHAAALFDPSITAIGLGQVGAVITFAAY